MAAGRADLLDKDLDKLVKYYMCSDHFEDHCFLDPDTRTRLKKTVRPVVVPIPTIFECNLCDVIPKDISRTLSPTKLQHATTPPATGNSMKVKPSEEQDDPDGAVVYIISGVEEDQEELINRDVYEIQSEDPISCRLCNTELEPHSAIVDIFDHDSISDALQVVLPGQIQKDDGYSQFICESCISDLDTSFSILTKFQDAQHAIRRPVDVIDLGDSFE